MSIFTATRVAIGSAVGTAIVAISSYKDSLDARLRIATEFVEHKPRSVSSVRVSNSGDTAIEVRKTLVLLPREACDCTLGKGFEPVKAEYSHRDQVMKHALSEPSLLEQLKDSVVALTVSVLADTSCKTCNSMDFRSALMTHNLARNGSIGGLRKRETWATEKDRENFIKANLKLALATTDSYTLLNAIKQSGSNVLGQGFSTKHCPEDVGICVQEFFIYAVFQSCSFDTQFSSLLISFSPPLPNKTMVTTGCTGILPRDGVGRDRCFT
jgi:hypothetical protein